MSAPPAVHPLCLPLAGLLGTWRGEGLGVYPTIATFAYGEEITFSHNGKPFLAYTQRTWATETTDAGPAGRPLHAEAGYLRPQAPSVSTVPVELVMAMPTGHLELGVAQWDHGVLRSVATVTGTASAKPVTEVVRELTLDGDELRYTLAMAAVGLALQPHLSATLHRLET
jgi:THAP4-like, heme-binding beta-barrel domain